MAHDAITHGVKCHMATGDGWQTRINETLRASLALAGKI
jgi:uncharacterized protein (DUF4415 family)